MKITLDTGRKTVVVHGEAAFEEIVNIVKMVDPEEWASYRLTCENVSIADYNEIGIAIQKKAMFDNFPSITANDYTNDYVKNGQHLICKQ